MEVVLENREEGTSSQSRRERGSLKLRRGEDAIAIIKSTEVMIARPSKGSTRA